MLLSVPDSSEYLQALERGHQERLRLQQMLSLEAQREEFRSTAIGLVCSGGLSDVYISVDGVLMQAHPLTVPEDVPLHFFQYIPSSLTSHNQGALSPSYEKHSFGAFFRE